MRRLLDRHYGPVEPKAAAAPKALKAALSAYFEGDLTSLDAIACATGGTSFQRVVWAALRGIPAGTTLSYGALAQRIGMRASPFTSTTGSSGAEPRSSFCRETDIIARRETYPTPPGCSGRIGGAP